ncbi:LLM class F420-dependent oxidoreductase [Actinocrinis puniceicyclus]|uniref:LLM class F420-dependent oxidoreductase n=1 Tax=Actinocrinis puniceicyclus TaxID=977794 RepID=A0A8J8BEU4_9ACTN|nr:LLM class F420-dependent oxidoreductase [Actinocrinis puniceicyclus]MBS2966743.1 LLM class F420-dependent oxidoreductase [Actinocrinis puniceicyclus]
MRIGYTIARFDWPGGAAAIRPNLLKVARTAEEGGLYSLWVMDHFWQIAVNGPAEDPMLEGYTALGFLAAATERVTLGTLVTGVTYRNPAILGKTVTTLDALSGGRAYLGIGAAWNQDEHEGYGVPFPSVKERFERLEEAIRITDAMWSGSDAGFEGEHYQPRRLLNVPAAISSPRPRLLIGGGGEQKTLRLVARYADACNLFDVGDEGLTHKLDVLRGHCEAEGRDFDEIEKTVLVRLAADGTAKPVAERAERLRELGFEHVILGAPAAANEHYLGVMSEVAGLTRDI